MLLRTLLAGCLCVSSVQAQDIDWLTLAKDDAAVDSAPIFGLSDDQEKDFAWGDLNRDGWIDLVVVRKATNLALGKRKNVLFMNENGVLTDRTSEFAMASDVPGDLGFLTHTADRDVVIADVDGDGWDDVITAATLSLGDPKHISHPRVYRNLGGTPGGAWNGLRYEDSRIPQFQVGGQDASPFFCAVGAGDVDGDGDLDLYFSDYSFVGNLDLDDRLLINDGTGHFVDESEARLTAAMRKSSFGTRAVLHDVNVDGTADIVKGMGTCACTETVGNFVRVLYNDPDQEGEYEFMQTAHSGSPYFFSVGDLNQDDLPDLVIANDFSLHRYRLNQGNNPFGLVSWGPEAILNKAPGTSNAGSAGNTIIADLDLDGWNDTIVCDFEVSVGTCFSPRGTSLYRNLGGTPGGSIEMRQMSGNGYLGASGWIEQDLKGVHDVAVFDVDLDGDPDIILGGCTGMEVWKNQLFADPVIGSDYCEPTANSLGVPAVLNAFGSPAVGDNDVQFFATSLPTGTFGYMILSESEASLPGFGGSQGVLCLGSPLVRFNNDVLVSTELGTMSFLPDLTQLPQGTVIQTGEEWNFQLWYRDVNPGPTSNTTGARKVVFQ